MSRSSTCPSLRLIDDADKLSVVPLLVVQICINFMKSLSISLSNSLNVNSLWLEIIALNLVFFQYLSICGKYLEIWGGDFFK